MFSFRKAQKQQIQKQQIEKQKKPPPAPVHEEIVENIVYETRDGVGYR